MASRKLVRDLLLTKRPHYRHLFTNYQQVSNLGTGVRLINGSNSTWRNYGNGSSRRFSVLKEFSEKVKGEATSNEQFQKSVKELKDKAGELKEVTEDLKVRTKQKTEKLYKQFDGAWTEAEATAKKVSENLKEKISAATEEVKESFGSGKEESTTSSETSSEDGGDSKNGSQSTSEEGGKQEPAASENENTYFGKFKSSFSSVSPKVGVVFQKLKEAKPIDFAKKGYDIVKDELSATPKRRKRLEYGPPPPTSTPAGERSTRKDVTIVPTKQSKFNKKWEALKAKIQSHPIFKRVSGMSEPVVVKSQELAEDIRDRWETSDSPVVHKIQDLSDTVLGETAAALSFKEIRARDPSFSLPEFVAEVQEVIRPVLNAYSKGDVEVLKKYCSNEVIERCKAERQVFESQGIFFDNKILHISDVEVRETKMMGETPIIIVVFQTQQVYCVRDKLGSVTDGGKDTIHTVYYGWAMQQVGVEELGEGALFPIWRLREIQQFNVIFGSDHDFSWFFRLWRDEVNNAKNLDSRKEKIQEAIRRKLAEQDAETE